MKRLSLVVVVLVAVLGALPARAASNALDGPRTFGIGVGDNGWASGLSGKLFLGGNTSAQLLVADCGWAARGYWVDSYGRVRVDGGRSVLCLGGDFLLEEPGGGRGPLTLNWNYGFGAGLLGLGASDIAFAVNGVVGGALQIVRRLEVAVEWRPTVFVGNGLGLDLLALGAHLRFYF